MEMVIPLYWVFLLSHKTDETVKNSPLSEMLPLGLKIFKSSQNDKTDPCLQICQKLGCKLGPL